MANDPNIRWEINKDGLRKRIRAYASKAVARLVALHAVYFSLWPAFHRTFPFWLYAGFLMAVDVLLALTLIRYYRSCPHRYEVNEEGVVLERSGRNQQWSWNEFRGYMSSQEALRVMTDELSMQPASVAPMRRSEVNSALATAKIGEGIFGQSLTLVRHRGFPLLPPWNSVVLQTQPNNSDDVERFVAERLKRLSPPMSTLRNKPLIILTAALIVIIVMGVVYFYLRGIVVNI